MAKSNIDYPTNSGQGNSQQSFHPLSIYVPNPFEGAILVLAKGLVVGLNLEIELKENLFLPVLR